MQSCWVSDFQITITVVSKNKKGPDLFYLTIIMASFTCVHYLYVIYSYGTSNDIKLQYNNAVFSMEHT